LGLLATALAAIALLAPTFAADVNIDKIAGVYKKRFQNGLVTGEKFQSENILEIVKHSPTTAYVRIHLEFFNAHLCDIAGIATIKNGALVYPGETDADDKQCLLTVRASRDRLTLLDPTGACGRTTCGARGMYNGVAFEMKQRRPIRYMKVILNSDEYKAAIEEYEKSEGKLPQ
jgi:hypothetical protein